MIMLFDTKALKRGTAEIDSAPMTQRAVVHRHRLVEPAQIRRLRLPRHVHHRAHRHEQQALEEDVVEGVGDGAVHRQRGPDPDPADHEADLVHHGVAERASEVVLDHGVEDREAGHERADVDQHLFAREPPRQGVHRHLGREGAEEDGAGGRPFRIRVDQPAVGQRERRLHPYRDEDEPRGQSLQSHRAEVEASGPVRVHHGAGEQRDARHDVHEQISHPRRDGFRGAPRPDEEDGADREQLPEDEEGDEVAREDRAQGAPGVDHGRGVLHGGAVALLQVQRVDDRDERAQVEQVAEEEAEPVGAHRGQRVPQELVLEFEPLLNAPHVQRTHDRDEHQPRRPQAREVPQEGHQQGAGEEDQERRDASRHRSSPPSASPRA